MSDAHWDNPLCKRDMLHRHLREALEIGAPVFHFGDFFCAMGGKYDPRRSKSKVRPEHNRDDYLQALVETAADDLLPYVPVLELMTQGNHESSVLKNCEFDLLQGLGVLLGYKAKDAGIIGNAPAIGTYQGWLRLCFKPEGTRWSQTVRIKWHHGHGGGGVVTKGTLHPQRRAAWFPDADVFVSGHVHEQWAFPVSRERINNAGSIGFDSQLHLQLPTYKHETAEGSGWAIERGMPPKPLGAWWLDFRWVHAEQRFVYSARMAT